MAVGRDVCVVSGGAKSQKSGEDARRTSGKAQLEQQE